MAKKAKTTAPKPTPLTADQKEFAKVHEEQDKLHEDVANAIPDGVDAVNPPYPISENIEAVKDNSKLNRYRETVVKKDINEMQAPNLAREDFNKDVEAFHKKHGVYPTGLKTTTATLDKLAIRQFALDANLKLVEGGDEDGKLTFTFGQEGH